jgi:hypothetical protein
VTGAVVVGGTEVVTGKVVVVGNVVVTGSLVDGRAVVVTSACGAVVVGEDGAVPGDSAARMATTREGGPVLYAVTCSTSCTGWPARTAKLNTAPLAEASQ